jgi:hypothetical protein
MNPNEVIALLEKVANGDMTASEALIAWPDVEKKEGRELGLAWHELHHFLADDDIRKKDIKYDKYQRALLLKRASDIREKILNLEKRDS